MSALWIESQGLAKRVGWIITSIENRGMELFLYFQTRIGNFIPHFIIDVISYGRAVIDPDFKIQFTIPTTHFVMPIL